MSELKPTVVIDHDNLIVTLPSEWIERMLRDANVRIVDHGQAAIDLAGALTPRVLESMVIAEAEFLIEDGITTAMSPRTAIRHDIGGRPCDDDDDDEPILTEPLPQPTGPRTVFHPLPRRM